MHFLRFKQRISGSWVEGRWFQIRFWVANGLVILHLHHWEKKIVDATMESWFIQSRANHNSAKLKSKSCFHIYTFLSKGKNWFPTFNITTFPRAVTLPTKLSFLALIFAHLVTFVRRKDKIKKKSIESMLGFELRLKYLKKKKNYQMHIIRIEIISCHIDSQSQILWFAYGFELEFDFNASHNMKEDQSHSTEFSLCLCSYASQFFQLSLSHSISIRNFSSIVKL